MFQAYSGGSCWLIIFRSGLLSPPPHGFSIPDFWTIGWQERKYAAHSCLFSIDKLSQFLKRLKVLSAMRIPFQPRSDERDIVGALGQLFLRLFIVPFHIRIRVGQPLCQASFFISTFLQHKKLKQFLYFVPSILLTWYGVV